MEKYFKQKKGITLIALVVTIIVLLILAGISIAMLFGGNGILKKTIDSKEITEMAEIKEQAELIKAGMTITKEGQILSQTELVNSIALDNFFSGSTKTDNIITTSNEKYDVIVDEKLNISVVKHIPLIVQNGDITLSIKQITVESKVIFLETTIQGVSVPTLEEWLRNLGTTTEGKEKLKTMFVYKMTNGGATWEQACSGTADVEDWYDKKVGNPNSDAYKFMIEQEWYDDTEYNETYVKTTISCNGQTQKVAKTAKFLITSNGSYTITSKNENGEKGNATVNVTKCKEEKYSEIQQSNFTTTIEGYTVTIPAGFAYGINENIGKVRTGLVITDSIDDNYNSNGNEFVWIPVDKTNLTVGNTNKKIAKLSTGSYAGIDNAGNRNYEGVLYSFTDKSSAEQTNYGQSGSKYKEPSIVSAYDSNDSQTYNGKLYLKEAGLTANGLATEIQQSYNSMIKSIQTYGGFYVSRYEMGVENNKAISKLGVKPVSSSDLEICKSMWYGLYQMAKTYTLSKNSIVSNMIWGSQYDAVLNYAIDSGSDIDKITSNTNGNHTKTVLETGYSNNDSIINIFDLEGNYAEVTQEADGNYCRASRGGALANYYNGRTPADRTSWNPISVHGTTRLALYVK